MGVGASLAGLYGGFHTGKSSAGTTANMLSSHGSKTINEEHARNLASLTAPVGSVAGLLLAEKHKGTAARYLRERGYTTPALLMDAWGDGAGALAGGYLSGAATGALTSLRGKKPSPKKEEEKKASLAKEAAHKFEPEMAMELIRKRLKSKANDETARDILSRVRRFDAEHYFDPRAGEISLPHMKDTLLRLDGKK